ncbi:TadE family protein [Nocardioides sp.]|uniref:TadE family protein n=1 Tax=Nocardioides sp. TaxID=35761 RepID=UPI001A2CB907|nr:TadE family protein [Nocardioides sp.]MBJ7356716.1 pilus assembly protein [Nocardioides sp.]
MTRYARTSREQGDRGTAAVELALVAPLLTLLVMGVISYGYMLSFRQALSQGAAEGARAAAVSPFPLAADRQQEGLGALNEALSSYGISCDGYSAGSQLRKDGADVGTCSVTIGPCANDATKNCVTAALSYAYEDNPLTPKLPGVGLLLPEDLRYDAVARTS